jgi:hypothetical protein
MYLKLITIFRDVYKYSISLCDLKLLVFFLSGKIIGNLFLIDSVNIPYFSIDNAHLMYNAHPKFFRNFFWCVDNAHDANLR